ncbi:alpha/beta hydrolase family protein [Streptomyces sp. NPDC088732]|uniref:alpha/beta hydrolase family protein n=1 Tax=Streptomyces sp. NPDC088732 TaxID=3365879 RepID=UPI00380A25F5
MRHLLFAQDENFWFETLRSLGHIAYGGADFGEVEATAERIRPGDYDSWFDEWYATAQRIRALADEARAQGHVNTARDSYLRASNYYRTAEFFLHGNPADPRILMTYDKAVDAFHDFAALSGTSVARVDIPFEGATLHGYFYPSPLPGEQPVVVMHNGFDGTAEEMHFFGAVAAQERGYHVLTFDGPGQPGARQHQGLLFRPDWENVVGPVLDHLSELPDVDTGRVALLGVSLGGELCLRAAAFEPRIKAVMAVDGVYDFSQLMLRFIEGDPEKVRAALRAPEAPEIDEQLAAAAESSPTARWAITHGMYVMGGDTPRQYAARTLDFNVRDGVAERIDCPVLICEAEDDLFFKGQPEEVFGHLTAPDKTLLRLTDAEGAGAHCHVGGQRYAFGKILDWLADRIPVAEPAASAVPA